MRDEYGERGVRTCSGAVTIRSRSWLPAWVRALTAPARAGLSIRIDSAAPSWLFGTPEASPLRAASAAATASAVSDLPRWRRAWRFGRITPATSAPRPAR